MLWDEQSPPLSPQSQAQALSASLSSDLISCKHFDHGLCLLLLLSLLFLVFCLKLQQYFVSFPSVASSVIGYGDSIRRSPQPNGRESTEPRSDFSISFSFSL